MLEGKDLALIVDGVAVTSVSVSEEDFDADTPAAWIILGQGRNVLLLWHAQIDGIRGNMTGGTSFAVTWFIVDRSKITGLAVRGKARRSGRSRGVRRR